MAGMSIRPLVVEIWDPILGPGTHRVTHGAEVVFEHQDFEMCRIAAHGEARLRGENQIWITRPNRVQAFLVSLGGGIRAPP
jgi:hypothetical protein